MPPFLQALQQLFPKAAQLGLFDSLEPAAPAAPSQTGLRRSKTPHRPHNHWPNTQAPNTQQLSALPPSAQTRQTGPGARLETLPEAPSSVSQLNEPSLPTQPKILHHPAATHRIHLRHSVVGYAFKRAKRKTIGFRITPDGLAVSAPRWVGMGEVERALGEKADWILRKLHEQASRTDTAPQPIVWREGAAVPYLGGHITLVLDPRHAFDGSAWLNTSDQNAVPQPLTAPNEPATQTATPQATSQTSSNLGFAHHTLHLGLHHDASELQIRDAVQAWLMRQAQALFAQRLAHFQAQLGVQYRVLKLSSAKSRWGSASPDGTIRLNWRLIHHPLRLIDYVVVHELSHLRHMDHSPRFWGTVASVLPDYAHSRTALHQAATPVV